MDFIKFVVEEADKFHQALKAAAIIEQAAFEAEVTKDGYEMPENDPEFDAKLEILGEKDPCI